MADLSHWIGGDLTLGPAGDLSPISGPVRGEQRVVRRLVTNPGGYLWHLDYGAGLPGFIGQPANPSQIEALVRAQMALEDAVSHAVEPSIGLQEIPNGIDVTIGYTDAPTAEPRYLSFDVTA